MKNLTKIIKDFEKLPYKVYVQKMPKHEPTDSYYYAAIQPDKCMMRDDAFHFHIDPVITEITDTQQIPIWHVFSSDES